jgi:hypothetical protein
LLKKISQNESKTFLKNPKNRIRQMLLASNEQFVRFDRAKVAQITNLRAATSTHYRRALPVLKFRIISANFNSSAKFELFLCYRHSKTKKDLRDPGAAERRVRGHEPGFGNKERGLCEMPRSPEHSKGQSGVGFPPLDAFPFSSSFFSKKRVKPAC